MQLLLISDMANGARSWICCLKYHTTSWKGFVLPVDQFSIGKLIFPFSILMWDFFFLLWREQKRDWFCWTVERLEKKNLLCWNLKTIVALDLKPMLSCHKSSFSKHCSYLEWPSLSFLLSPQLGGGVDGHSLLWTWDESVFSGDSAPWPPPFASWPLVIWACGCSSRFPKEQNRCIYILYNLGLETLPARTLETILTTIT